MCEPPWKTAKSTTFFADELHPLPAARWHPRQPVALPRRSEGRLVDDLDEMRLHRNGRLARLKRSHCLRGRGAQRVLHTHQLTRTMDNDTGLLHQPREVCQWLRRPRTTSALVPAHPVVLTRPCAISCSQAKRQLAECR